jgi:hypothetical protein
MASIATARHAQTSRVHGMKRAGLTIQVIIATVNQLEICYHTPKLIQNDELKSKLPKLHLNRVVRGSQAPIYV